MCTEGAADSASATELAPVVWQASTSASGVSSSGLMLELRARVPLGYCWHEPACEQTPLGLVEHAMPGHETMQCEALTWASVAS